MQHCKRVFQYAYNTTLQVFISRRVPRNTASVYFKSSTTKHCKNVECDTAFVNVVHCKKKRCKKTLKTVCCNTCILRQMCTVTSTATNVHIYVHCKKYTLYIETRTLQQIYAAYVHYIKTYAATNVRCTLKHGNTVEQPPCTNASTCNNPLCWIQLYCCLLSPYYYRWASIWLWYFYICGWSCKSRYHCCINLVLLPRRLLFFWLFPLTGNSLEYDCLLQSCYQIYILYIWYINCISISVYTSNYQENSHSRMKVH